MQNKPLTDIIKMFKAPTKQLFSTLAGLAANHGLGRMAVGVKCTWVPALATPL